MPTTSAPTPDANTARLTLALGSTEYRVRPLAVAELPTGAARGFRLTRTDGQCGKIAHIVALSPRGASCSCGDFRHRQASAGGACKHLRAARACGLI